MYPSRFPVQLDRRARFGLVRGAAEAGEPATLWRVDFEGEGGIDSGGLFRESICDMCAELQVAAPLPGPIRFFSMVHNQLRCSA